VSLKQHHNRPSLQPGTRRGSACSVCRGAGHDRRRCPHFDRPLLPPSPEASGLDAIERAFARSRDQQLADLEAERQDLKQRIARLRATGRALDRAMEAAA
jgi:hypothetical protein